METVKKNKHSDVIRRWEGNPIITLDDVPFRCSDICNAAAVKFKDEYILLITIENMNGRKSLYKAKSKDGYRFKVVSKPFISRSMKTRSRNVRAMILQEIVTPSSGSSSSSVGVISSP